MINFLKYIFESLFVTTTYIRETSYTRNCKVSRCGAEVFKTINGMCEDCYDDYLANERFWAYHAPVILYINFVVLLFVYR